MKVHEVTQLGKRFVGKGDLAGFDPCITVCIYIYQYMWVCMFSIDLTYLGDFPVRKLWTSQVCYETFGHAFYLEDGIETGNVFEKNLVASIRPGGSLCSDWQVASGSRSNLQLGPSGFWITNPNNSCWHCFRGRFFLEGMLLAKLLEISKVSDGCVFGGDVIGQVVFAGD